MTRKRNRPPWFTRNANSFRNISSGIPQRGKIQIVTLHREKWEQWIFTEKLSLALTRCSTKFKTRILNPSSWKSDILLGCKFNCRYCKVSISRIAKATRCSNKCATYTYIQRTRRVDVAQPRLLGICVEVRSHNRVQHSRTVLDAKTKTETNDKIGRQRGDRDKVTEVNKHGERSRRTG